MAYFLVFRDRWWRRSLAVFGALGAFAAGLAEDRPPNLLLITLDTTRADRLGCYGYRQGQTPRLDRLAREGVLAEQAIAVAPTTLPAHASILTGLYPPRHGVRDNADFRLPPEEVTLAEHLKAQGYSTAAVVASVVLSSSQGLAQGFDAYDEPRDPPSAAFVAQKLQFHPLLDRPADQVTAAALTFLDLLQSKPFFLWVHYFDPHSDYAPPAPWNAKFAKNLYDGEIAFMDGQIGRLLDGFSARGLLDRTLVAVIGDHGEGLGDHGEETHGVFLYEPMVRVPLLLRLPGTLPKSARYPGLVSQVDLAPSLLDLMGLPALPGPQGISLAAGLKGGKAAQRDPVYSESVMVQRVYGWSPLYALRGEAWKFIEAPAAEYFDLRKDPGEKNNLAAADQPALERARQALAALRAGLGTSASAAEKPADAERRAQLASLGYLAAPAGEKTSPGPDPKKMTAVANLISRATDLVSGGKAEQAASLVQQAMKLDPANPALLTLSGSLKSSRGPSAEGLKQIEAAVRAAPRVYENQRNLAYALVQAGRMKEASAALRAALDLRPEGPEDHFFLGHILSALRDPEAAKAFRRALELGLDEARVHLALGNVLLATGDSAGAEAAFQGAVARDPRSAPAWTQLGVVAEKEGRREEALQAWDKALAIEPDRPDTLFDRAKTLLLSGDRAGASRDLQHLLNKHPRYGPAKFLLGHYLEAEGQREAAVKVLREFLDQPGNDPALVEAARRKIRELSMIGLTPNP